MQKLFLRCAVAYVIVGSISGIGAATITGPFTIVAGSGSLSSSTSGGTWSITESISSFDIIGRFGLNFQLPSGPQTTYEVTKRITNNTSDTWVGFQVGIGCGTSGETPCFGNNSPSNPLNMNSAPTPGSSAGGVLSVFDSAHFGYSGINIAPGQTFTLTFSLTTCPNCSGSWNMFQTADIGGDVPEPAAYLLAGPVLIAFGVIGRRRRER